MTFRYLRILEYTGDEQWLRMTFAKNAVQPGAAFGPPNGRIREILCMQIVNEDGSFPEPEPELPTP